MPLLIVVRVKNLWDDTMGVNIAIFDKLESKNNTCKKIPCVVNNFRPTRLSYIHTFEVRIAHLAFKKLKAYTCI